ncbi:FxLYD domain-containing protein [Natrinema halophilum]|uniref:Uncharacterized protein n=1 Tax=Natrinema halophilum TaxID=1699371 RepID=A0A7D5GJJ9_9EURY|nr:FxLYD domain-containing protein [Natrinema halophilum]QLG47892.1 FxLYD domain-containing protein [Natrinema halophilum]
MNRRQLLSVMGTATVAGCVGDDMADTSGPEDSSDDGGTSSTNGTDTNPSEPEPAIDVSVSDVSLGTMTTPNGRTETAVTGLVKNTGEARLGAVTAAGKFYNADGQLLSSAIWDIRDLVPGEIWEPWIPYSGDGTVDSADLTITDSFAHGRTVSPNGMVLESHDLQIPVDDYAMPRVLGEVSNQTETSVPALLARPKLIAENGHLLETAIATVQNFGAGETWSFDTQVHFQNSDWIDRIDSYQIVLTV